MIYLILLGFIVFLMGFFSWAARKGEEPKSQYLLRNEDGEVVEIGGVKFIDAETDEQKLKRAKTIDDLL